jgi:hypothetical protein
VSGPWKKLVKKLGLDDSAATVRSEMQCAEMYTVEMTVPGVDDEHTGEPVLAALLALDEVLNPVVSADPDIGAVIARFDVEAGSLEEARRIGFAAFIRAVESARLDPYGVGGRVFPRRAQ